MSKQAQAVTPLVFFQLNKVDEAQRLVYGRAVQEVPDRVGEVFDYETSVPFFKAWASSQFDASLGKSNGNLRAMHKDVAAGIVVPGGLTYHDDERAIDIVAKVTDDQEWEKVTSGTYTGFSIGGRYAKKWEDTELKKTRYTADPSEISLVDRPCIGTATFFEVQKADGTLEKRDFAKPKKGDKKTVDGKEMEFDGENWVEATKAEPAGEVQKVETVEEYDIEATPEQVDEFCKLLALSKTPFAQVLGDLRKRVPVEPSGEAIDAKAIELAKVDGIDLTDAKALADVEKVNGYKEKARVELKKIAAREDADPKAVKKYGGVKFADAKNKKYPLDTPEQVVAAAKYWGKPENMAKYSAEDQKTISTAIAAAEKEHGIGGEKKDDGKKFDAAIESVVVKLAKAAGIKSEGLAKDSKELAPLYAQASRLALRKNLAMCSEFAMLCDSLCRLQERIEYEEELEGDDTELPARMMNACVDLCDILADMVREECAEQAEGKEVNDGFQAPAMAMVQALGDLKKRAEVLRPLVKFGARNSAKDQDALQKAHDALNAAGARCNKAFIFADSEPGDVKADKGTVNTGSNAQPAAAPAPNDKAQPAEDLQKAVTEAAELRKMVESLTKDVATLKAQPAAPRIRLRAVGKGDEITPEGEQVTKVDPVKDAHGEQRDAATLIKSIHQSGGEDLYRFR